MLKRDSNGQFKFREVGLFKTRRLWRFYAGKTYTQGELEEEEYKRLLEMQKHGPIVVMKDNSCKKKWWMYLNEVYWEDEGFSAEEMKALILEKIDHKEKRVKRAITRLSHKEALNNIREPIPDEIKMIVWQRDGGRCVHCGSREKLEYDHIIPISKGGSNTARNIQLLCEKCNRSKGPNLF